MLLPRPSLLCMLLSCLLLCPPAAAQGYERSINDGWSFRKEGCSVTQTVSLPHTWNAEDAVDDEPGYWRGIGWYDRKLLLNDELGGKKVFVRFEGANQEVDLFVNGQHAGNHKGGYTAFVFDITPFIRPGENTFQVKVDNSHNEGIPPMGADFTFFGGIYRDVSLVFLPENHISIEHFASSGVYITTPEVSPAQASVEIQTHLSIGRPEKKLLLEQVILDPEGKRVASVRQTIRKPSGKLVLSTRLQVPQPLLWDVEDPALYAVETSLLDQGGAVIDTRRNSFGIRTFRFDPDSGFFLNGRHLSLIGTNRHQDYPGLGNALPDEMHLRDIRLLKEMGGNFLRISHYPQDPLISGLCDRLGILSCVEIPVVNRIGLTEAFTPNCENMAREMVYQHFNHPSMVAWAYMNEVLLDPSPWKDGTLTREMYYSQVKDCAAAIDAAIRAADPSRPTLIPCDGDRKKYQESGLGDIPDILGFNLYHGWYYGRLSDLEAALDKLHATFPGKALFVSEYGADADVRLHSFEPERQDYTGDYALLLHRSYLPVLQQKAYLSGATVWNLNDFHSEARGFALPHFNCKGLTTAERVPKDSYWWYKAKLGKQPFLKISDWRIRGGQESGGACIQPVEVFATAPEVALWVNGEPLGHRPVRNGSAVFDVPFRDGENVLEARGSDSAADLLRVDFRMVPEDLSRFRELNVLLGTRRYFEDRKGGRIWIPEQAYQPGSWGYVGGERMYQKTTSSLRPAFEADIPGTDMDPLFQTQRAGLEAFLADVPDGSYAVYLYFADLTGPFRGKPMLYGLGNDALPARETARVFSVAMNGVTVLRDLNLAEEYGYNTAVVLRFPVTVTGERGLRIDFVPSQGLTVLNAIRIVKVQ